jgi:hypothetical protein
MSSPSGQDSVFYELARMTCTYVCIYICAYIYTYKYIYMHTHTHTHTHTCVCLCVCVYVRVRVRMRMCMRESVCVCVCRRRTSQDPEQMRAIALQTFRHDPDALRDYAMAAGEYVWCEWHVLFLFLKKFEASQFPGHGCW